MLLRKLAIFIGAVFSATASYSVDYIIGDGERLVGQNYNFTIPQGKRALEEIASLTNLGLSNMMEANPLVDPYLPAPGTVLLIPHQLILPNTVHSGIVINSAEMRLYYYPSGTNQVVVLPIGIGQLGKDTPVGWVTKVERKKAGPTWTPSAKVRAEYAAEGEILPAVVPAGPDTPMGLYALYVGRLYAIHGTNRPNSVGGDVSYGCVRMYNQDISDLFERVDVGTPVVVTSR